MENKELTLAVAQLAAAAISANPELSMEDAVKGARDSLCKVQLSSKQIKDTIKTDKIKCLEDDTWHTMLRRYLRRKFNMSTDAYIKKWGLPDNYPFVAPDYARLRSQIAKKTGLGKGVNKK